MFVEWALYFGADVTTIQLLSGQNLRFQNKIRDFFGSKKNPELAKPSAGNYDLRNIMLVIGRLSTTIQDIALNFALIIALINFYGYLQALLNRTRYSNVGTF